MERILLTYQGSTAGQILAKLPAKAAGKTSAQLKECIRLIVNETDGKILMRSMKKNTLSAVSAITDDTYTHVLQLADNTLNLTGKTLSIKVDLGESAEDIIFAMAPLAKADKLQEIATALVTMSEAMAKNTTVAKEAALGMPADGASASTLFGKVAGVKGETAEIKAALGSDAQQVTAHEKLDGIKSTVEIFATGYAIEQKQDGTYRLNLDKSAAVNGRTLNIS